MTGSHEVAAEKPRAAEEQLRAALEENARMKELLEERQHLLEQMVPPPVVADLLERQRHCQSSSDVWSSAVADELQARFLRRERMTDAPHVGQAKAVSYPALTVFFSDIVGFTDMSQRVSELELMAFLNDLYSQMDELLSKKYRMLWKVETIGDSYMVAAGLTEIPGKPLAPEDSARDVVAFAREVLHIASSMKMPTGQPCRLRVGVHSGPASAGVVGSKMPRYCLFGETVNIASRMESTGEACAVQVSEQTWGLLGERLEDKAAEDGMQWRARGGVFVKGKGVMNTYLLQKPTESSEALLVASARGSLPLELRCCNLALVLGFAAAGAGAFCLTRGLRRA